MPDSDRPDSPTDVPQSEGPRSLAPVPGIFGPDEVDAATKLDEEPSGYPDDPAAPPPSTEPLIVETEPVTQADASSYPDVPDARPPSESLTGDAAMETKPAPSLLPVPMETVEAAKEATRSRARDFGRLVLRYATRYWPERTASAEPIVDEPPRLVGRMGQIIPYMRIIPWTLAALFAASFAWDFPGMTVSVLGEPVSVEGLLRIVSVSGLIGFFTNWLAITMLFQPREKRVLIPQGLIPAQRERVIFRLAQAISQELINEEIIKEKIHESGVIGRYRDIALGVVRGVVEDPEFRTDLKGLTGEYVQEVLGSEAIRKELAQVAAKKVEEQAGQGLGGVALRLYRTFAEDDFQRRIDAAIAELPGAVSPLLDRLDTALDQIPEKVESRADELEAWATKAVLSFVEGLDVHAMIIDNARGYDEAQLERILKSTSNEQLNYIKYLGGILGLFGGLVIWQPIASLAVFAVLTLAVWGLDEVLVRARRKTT